MMKRNLCAALAMVVACVWSVGVGAAEPTATTTLKGLNNPCGIAIQPETGVVFVSDSGAGKVVKLVDGKAVDVITDFVEDGTLDDFHTWLELAATIALIGGVLYLMIELRQVMNRMATLDRSVRAARGEMSEPEKRRRPPAGSAITRWSPARVAAGPAG